MRSTAERIKQKGVAGTEITNTIADGQRPKAELVRTVKRVAANRQLYPPRQPITPPGQTPHDSRDPPNAIGFRATLRSNRMEHVYC